MTKKVLTDFTPIEFQYQELDLPYQEIEFSLEPIKVDWAEAKTLYLADNKLTYQDIADKYGVSLKQVKKWGARQQWREGRQEVSKLAEIKTTENLAESAAETNHRHADMYQQAQELLLAQLAILDVQTTIAVDNAEREERTIAMNELPSPATLLSLTKSLVTAVNGERVCLGLPTAVEPAPVGYKPPVKEDPELANLPFVERMRRIASQPS
jgi:hypothetical protein